MLIQWRLPAARVFYLTVMPAKICNHVGMKAHAIQYTIRGVPKEVDRALRDLAQRRKISLNEAVIEGLTKSTVGHRQVSDFSKFLGMMDPDDAFDGALKAQREISEEDWK